MKRLEWDSFVLPWNLVGIWGDSLGLLMLRVSAVFLEELTEVEGAVDLMRLPLVLSPSLSSRSTLLRFTGAETD